MYVGEAGVAIGAISAIVVSVFDGDDAVLNWSDRNGYLYGGDGADALWLGGHVGGASYGNGGGGNDAIISGPGNDTIDGASGSDTVSYRDSADPVSASLTTNTGGRSYDNDAYYSIENLAGGGATRAVTEDGVVWQEGAARHEAGSPNVIGAVALAAACHALRTHHERVEAHEGALATRLLEGLRAIDGVQTYSLFGEDHDRVAVATFTIDGLDSSLVSTVLSAEHGIGVRDGKFCAHLCVDALLDDPYAAEPTTAVRASVGLATTAEHVERLLTAVADLAAHGPRAAYTHGPQGWAPVRDPRALDVARPW